MPVSLGYLVSPFPSQCGGYPLRLILQKAYLAKPSAVYLSDRDKDSGGEWIWCSLPGIPRRPPCTPYVRVRLPNERFYPVVPAGISPRL